MSENVCCPNLGILACGDTNEHKHLVCHRAFGVTLAEHKDLLPHHAFDGTLVDKDTVKLFCVGNFTGCPDRVKKGDQANE